MNGPNVSLTTSVIIHIDNLTLYASVVGHKCHAQTVPQWFTEEWTTTLAPQ